MEELYHSIKKDCIKDIHYDVVLQKKDKVKQFDDFIPDFARTLHIRYLYIIHINENCKIKLNVDKKLNQKYLDICCKWLYFFYTRYSHHKIKKKFYIGCFTNKRIFNCINNIIPKNQINGGATYKKPNQYIIYIYRIEEFERLCIHELIHAFDLDEYLFDSNEYTFFNYVFNDGKLFKQMNEFICHPYIFEIFTQSLTILLMSIDKVEHYNELQYECNKCIIHIIPIIHKIIYTFNEIGSYKEETSILSYFFGVCFVLCNINNFCIFCIKYSNKNIHHNSFINDFKKIIIDGKYIYLKKYHHYLTNINNVYSLKLTPY